MNVMTVCGEIPVEQLGITQMHEHVLANTDFDGNDYNLKIDDVDIAIEELTYFKNAGGQTMVDLTCVGIGQDVRGVKRVAEKTGVNIITATGFYRECSYPAYVHHETADELARRMIRDVREGIDGTAIRPGILAEIATEYGRGKMSPLEEKVFTAVAYAQRETGLPVSTHCWAGEMAFAQIDVLTRNGVPPKKIIIGHLAVDPSAKDRILAVADKGVYLGIDCIGYWYEKVVTMKDPEKAQFVRELIRHGHLRQITIAQDLARKLLLKHYHGIGYEYLLLKFIPLLHTAGVSDTETKTILIDNPRSVFSGS
jgi:predicted metal-dependent phosphotriesterase family hydrolase